MSTIVHDLITERLGEGGTGGECRAADTALNRDVALLTSCTQGDEAESS